MVAVPGASTCPSAWTTTPIGLATTVTEGLAAALFEAAWKAVSMRNRNERKHDCRQAGCHARTAQLP
jgi:hypothetical protein